MASAAEQLAANLNFGAFAKATELKRRLLFLLGVLVVYRFGTFVPIPGMNPAALNEIFSQNSAGLLGVLDMFAGGALGRMSIFALGLMPYITASIILNLMTTVSPKLEALKKEGESGRKKINQYTRYLMVVLAAFQSYGMAVGLEGAQSSQGPVVLNPGVFFQFTTVITIVGGTAFLMWLGEQISTRGVGNGISIIIFAGIVAGLPQALAQVLELGRTGALSPLVIIVLLVGAIGLITFIVFIERAQRRILVQYPKRQVGNRMFGGESSHLPLKINTAGVIPAIFASSILLMPTTLVGFGGGSEAGWVQWLAQNMVHGQPFFMLLYGTLIAFFAFFYTAIVFNPQDTADNLRKNGGFIPGIRPGKNTADYLDYVLTRLTAVGALYLVFVCLLPEFLISQGSIPFYLGGTSLLIVVTVTMDTIAQIQSHLLAHQYEGLIKRSRLRGRRG